MLRKTPRFVDETIRDGLQSPSVTDPTIEQKMELVRLMDRLGIDVVDLGLPGAGRRAVEGVEHLQRRRRGEGISLNTRTRGYDLFDLFFFSPFVVLGDSRSHDECRREES